MKVRTLKMAALICLPTGATIAAMTCIYAPPAKAVSAKRVSASKPIAALQDDNFDCTGLGTDSLDSSYANAAGYVATDDPNPQPGIPSLYLDASLTIGNKIVWTNRPPKSAFGLPISNDPSNPTNYNYSVALASYLAGLPSGTYHIVWAGIAEGPHDGYLNNPSVESVRWEDVEDIVIP